ncbi:glycoside hydrolase family 16 protein [Streptomyces sp. NPDC026665]|uniref:glycoside hydrolase family 16 protein n=1 Tax=Streptomyces sp. NPDC026665 TaxID=3154798 RepID=UPI00340D2202
MTARGVVLGALMLLLVACGAGGPAPGTTSGTATPRPPAQGDWRLVFHDDFDGSRLDKNRWTTCYDWNEDGCTISTNHELEWYQPGQVSVSGGKVSLDAERRTIRGSDGKDYPWVSGMISTGRDNWYAQPRKTFTYGYFEAAIRIPSQGGMSPEFWMMPASRYTPPEIDIVEFLGTTRTASMFVHWRNAEGQERKQKGTFTSDGFPDRYHVFGLLWEKDRLVWYVDGIERFRVSEPERIPHEPMEVILNLAVGLPYTPPPGTDSARMLVDWVRVWQR